LKIPVNSDRHISNSPALGFPPIVLKATQTNDQIVVRNARDAEDIAIPIIVVKSIGLAFKKKKRNQI
jgi:hypothetical protein